MVVERDRKMHAVLEEMLNQGLDDCVSAMRLQFRRAMRWLGE